MSVRWALELSRQNGYVVAAAVAQSTRARQVRPFFVADRFAIDDFDCLEPPGPIALKLALDPFGPIQAELIEVLSEGPSDFHRFRQTCGEDLHHLAFWVRSFERGAETLRATGWLQLGAGWTIGGEPFAYSEPGGQCQDGRRANAGGRRQEEPVAPRTRRIRCGN